MEVCNSGSAFNSIFVHAKYTSSMCVWHWRQWRHCNSWISRNFRIEIWSPVIWAKHQLTTDDKPTGQRSTGRRIVSESNTNPNPDTGPKFYRPVICFFCRPVDCWLYAHWGHMITFFFSGGCCIRANLWDFGGRFLRLKCYTTISLQTPTGSITPLQNPNCRICQCNFLRHGAFGPTVHV